MSSQRRPLIALAAVAIFVGPGPVRAQEFSGTWTAEVPVRIGNDNGVETVEETATVTITLVQTGAGVEGTWQMSPRPDNPAPRPRTLRGAVRDGRVVLTDTVTAMLRRDGELPTDVQMINTLDLRIEKDRLVGTESARSTDGRVTTEPRPFSATRSS